MRVIFEIGERIGKLDTGTWYLVPVPGAMSPR
jgi:hypothetical protein